MNKVFLLLTIASTPVLAQDFDSALLSSSTLASVNLSYKCGEKNQDGTLTGSFSEGIFFNLKNGSQLYNPLVKSSVSREDFSSDQEFLKDCQDEFARDLASRTYGARMKKALLESMQIQKGDTQILSVNGKKTCGTLALFVAFDSKTKVIVASEYQMVPKPCP